jgi:hypothetical protein
METLLGMPVVMSKEPLPGDPGIIFGSPLVERIKVEIEEQKDGTFIGTLPSGQKLRIHCVGEDCEQ